ncbi:receptor activity-modifying protein 1 isoform X2 [Castor canadensis]|uniref:Receptor activity-modifying protein 1 isoform X2 n=1 Tax=Castor canadensis TaxID=51338 RepID=A0AC58MFN8_CASCN
MAAGLCGLPRRGLWLLLAHHLFMVTACQDAHYGTLIQELCLARFKEDMEAVGRPLWCDWGKTIKKAAGSPPLGTMHGPHFTRPSPAQNSPGLQELQGPHRLHQARGRHTGLLLAQCRGGQVLRRHPSALL